MPRGSRCASSTGRRRCGSRSRTTAGAAPTRPPAPACAASPTASRRSAGASPSPTARGAGPSCRSSCPSRLTPIGVELLERDGDRAVLAAAIEESRAAGRVVVVAGEAGIGKTALVTAGCEALGPRPVLWGACDPLITPRAMGPLRDAARVAGGALLAALDGTREDVLAATLD